jgi:hypothetical protein
MELFRSRVLRERVFRKVRVFGNLERITHKCLRTAYMFLDDSDPSIRLNGLKVLQRVIYGPLNDEHSNTARELFEKAALDPDQVVRERAHQIRSHLPEHQKHLR